MSGMASSNETVVPWGVRTVLGVLYQTRDGLGLAAALRARQPVCHEVPHALRRPAGRLSGWAP
eukprot:13411318-Alexandrium_andersonii.AAC.1